MKEFLIKINELVEIGNMLEINERQFFGGYLEDIARDISRNYDNNEIDLLNELKNSNADDFVSFLEYLLNKAIETDNNQFISSVCSYSYGIRHLPESIRDILLSGINNTDKSNRLRERFFWVFNHNFKEDSINFYINNLEKFIQDNSENIELLSDIFDFAHWHINREIEYFESINQTINQYCSENKNIIEHLHSTTMELFKIENVR